MPDSSVKDPSTASSVAKPSQWFHFRWRAVLVVFLLIAVPVVYLIRQQSVQLQAISELKTRGAILRTEPLLIPFADLIAGAENTQQLMELYWIGADVSADDLAVLSDVKSLRKLELTNSHVEEAGLQHLAGLPNLYTLHLSGTDVGDDALKAVSQMNALEILSLNKTKISDDGLQQLAVLPILERLFLNNTPLTDRGMESLAQMVQLKELSLKNLPITDEGLGKLKTLVNLEVLGLDNNPNLTREGILDLRKNIPGLVFLLDEQSASNPATQDRQSQDRDTSPLQEVTD